MTAATERDQARADLRVAIEERETWRSNCIEARETLVAAVAERDRLRAVLEETPENVAVVAQFFDRYYGAMASPVEWVDSCGPAVALLAALRARAGMATTHDCGRDHPQHDVLCIDGSPPPAWSVVCDDVPDVVHVRDDGHVCANPRPRLPR